MRIDSSFQPDESCIAFTVARAWRTDFTNTAKDDHGNVPEHSAIRRAIDDVFAFLADFENVPTWNYAIVETKKTPPDRWVWEPPTDRSVPSPTRARKALMRPPSSRLAA